MNREELKQIIKEELEAVTKIGQPVRRPFSNYNYYNQGRYRHNKFQDVTDKYNITYKSQNPGTYGFEEVLYSEPHNILVAFPSEENKDFDQPYAILGLKAARGYGKDHRFLDRGMEGAGVYELNQGLADRLLQNGLETLKEVGSEYVRNFDVLGAPETLEESANRNRELTQTVKQKMKRLEQQAKSKLVGEGGRAPIRERVSKELAPPGWSETPRKLQERWPDVFGGDNPEINPHTLTWGIYMNL